MLSRTPIGKVGLIDTENACDCAAKRVRRSRALTMDSGCGDVANLPYAASETRRERRRCFKPQVPPPTRTRVHGGRTDEERSTELRLSVREKSAGLAKRLRGADSRRPRDQTVLVPCWSRKMMVIRRRRR
jgi:hypothetical protein